MSDNVSKSRIDKLLKKLDLSDDSPIDDDSVWDIISKFVQEIGLNSLQLNSFNDFVQNRIHEIVQHLKHLRIECDQVVYEVDFSNLYIKPPKFVERNEETIELYPKMCLDRNISYLSELYIDIKVTIPNGICRLYKGFFIGLMPVMVKSCLCNLYKIGNDEDRLAQLEEDFYDPGGYFVLVPKGGSGGGSDSALAQRRYITCQEKSAVNQVYVFANTRKTAPKYDLYAEMRSMTSTGSSTMTTIGFLNGNIGVILPKIDGTDIPLAIVFCALGTGSPLDIYRMILEEENLTNSLQDTKFRILYPSLEFSFEISEQDRALEYIGRRIKKRIDKKRKGTATANKIDEEAEAEEIPEADPITLARSLLSKDLFPSEGVGEDTFKRKALFLAYMVNRLLSVAVGDRPPEDRDHYMNKRISTAGYLMGQQFYGAFRKMITDITTGAIKNIRNGTPVDIRSFIKHSSFTTLMYGAIANNSWIFSGVNSKGIAQLCEQFNAMTALNNMRKLVIPMSADGGGKLIEPRDLHQSYYPYICPAETPEGKRCTFRKEKVYTEKGPIKIEDLMFGDIVYTVDIDNGKLVGSEFSDLFFKKDDVHKIETDGGWKLRATLDHPFYTEKGYKDLGKLDIKKDRVLVIRTLPSIRYGKNKEILLENVDRVIEFKNFQDCTINKYNLFLENRGILPLRYNSPQLHILARILGFTFADASISIKNFTWRGDFGRKRDALDFINDMVILGFDEKEYKRTVNTRVVEDGDREYTQKTYRVCYGSDFVALLLCLDAPFGKKPRKDCPFPDWILDCNRTVQREFVAGFQGGDGGSPWFGKRKDKKNAYAFIFGDIVKHKKEEEHVASQQDFFKKLASIMHKDGIETCEIRTEYRDHRGYVAWRVMLPMSNSMESIINYGKYIGYRYASTKNNKLDSVWYYLCYKKDKWDERKRMKEDIVRRHEETRESPKKMAEEYGITTRQVHSILEQKNSETLAPRDLETPDQFQERLQHGGCFMNIKRIKYVGRGTVADFTTVSKNHNFIANGFVTHNCGIVKHLAFSAIVTLGTDPEPIKEIVKTDFNQIIDHVSYNSNIPIKKLCKVFVGGNWIGYVKNGKRFCREFLKRRRSGLLDPYTSITFFEKYREIFIKSDAGRLTRPVFIVENGEITISQDDIDGLTENLSEDGKGRVIYSDTTTLNELLAAGKIEMLDVDEQENSIVLGYPSELYKLNKEARLSITHVDLHPALLYGPSASTVPFPNHDQSPRITYQAAMGKQAIGIPFTNYKQMVTATFHFLHYPQLSIVMSRSFMAAGYDRLPSGCNAMLAIMPRPFNEEDSIEMVKESVQRGFMVSTKMIPYYCEVKSERNESFGIPTEERCEQFRGNNRHLTREGFAKPGSKVCQGDILIAKLTRNTDEARKRTKKEYSASVILYDEEWPGVVDAVQIGTTGEGYPYIRVSVAQQREPIIGDKFCFTPNHEIKTATGWVPVAKITKKHRVMSLSGNRIVYENPIAVHAFDINENVIRIENSEIKVIVTVEHDVYVRVKEGFYLEKAKYACQYDSFYKSENDEILVRKEDYFYEHYRGKVHCCTVPSGKLFVRFAGDNNRAFKPIWTGNSSMHSQKGVLGMLINQIDAPRDSRGINPDIIMNSLAFPSRMTIAMLIEILMGKAICATSLLHYVYIRFNGKSKKRARNGIPDRDDDVGIEFAEYFSNPKYPHLGDATPFRKFSLQVIQKELAKYGFDRFGDEILYDGITGEPYRGLVMFGPVYYQRLKHMVYDKMHARAKGPRTTLFRQPTEGRSSHGGLRTGCMERDVIVGQGAVYFGKDRLFDQSDPYRTYVCSRCGLKAHVDAKSGIAECNLCPGAEIRRVNSPYGTEIISDELMGMNLVTRKLTDPFEEK